MAYIDTEKLFDIQQREALLDRVFGADRFAKTCERLREGRLPARDLAFVVRSGDRVAATLRFWHVDAGKVPALMLGPLAVDPLFRNEGWGGKLINHGLEKAREIGHRGVILVGDAPYYARFGFDRSVTERLVLPGPVDYGRFLGVELASAGMSGARGMVRPTGAVPLRPVFGDTQRRKAA